MRWFWFTFKRGFPVTFHLRSDYTVTWKRIYGVQIGLTFIGVVQSEDRVPVAPVPATEG